MWVSAWKVGRSSNHHRAPTAADGPAVAICDFVQRSTPERLGRHASGYRLKRHRAAKTTTLITAVLCHSASTTYSTLSNEYGKMCPRLEHSAASKVALPHTTWLGGFFELRGSAASGGNTGHLGCRCQAGMQWQFAWHGSPPGVSTSQV